MNKEQPVSTRGITRDDSALLFIETDLNAVITYANDALVKITGYRRDELIDENIRFIYHPDTPQWLIDDLYTTIKGGHPWQGTLKNRTQLDETYWVHAIVTPILRTGKITGSLSLWKTPSKKKIAEAEILYRTVTPPNASFSIKRWFSQLRLQTKLQLLIQSAILLTGLLATLGLYGQMTAAILENAQDRAEATAREIIDSANLLMVTGDASDPASRKLMIKNIKEGQKLLSLKLVRTAQVVRQFGPGLPEEHLNDPLIKHVIEHAVKLGKPVPHFSLEYLQGRPVFRAITPYLASHNLNETDCLTCHKVAVGSFNGASDILIDLSAEFNRLHRTILLLIAGLAILQGFLFFFIGWVIHRFVSRPAEKLKKHLHKITHGDYTESLDISGRDEMGELACSVQTTKLLLGSAVDLVSIKLTET
ncbi:MAG: PAS domain S-box protein, partial [Gallionella sp.]